MSRFCLLHPSHPGLSVARCLSATQKTYNTVGSRLLRRSPRSLGVPLRWRSPKSYHPTHTNAANQATFPKKHWPTNAFKRFTPTPKRFSLAAGKPQDKAFHRRKKAFQREDHGSSRQSKAFQRREIRALPARKGISGAKQGTKQPARKGSKRNKRGGKAPLFRRAKQFTGGARHNRAGARQIRGVKAAGLRPAKTQNSCWASAGWQFREKGTEAGGGESPIQRRIGAGIAGVP